MENNENFKNKSKLINKVMNFKCMYKTITYI